MSTELDQVVPVFSLAQEVAPALESLAVHLVAVVGERSPVVETKGRPGFKLTAEGAYWAKAEPSTVLVVFPFDVTFVVERESTEIVELGHISLHYQIVYGLTKPLDSWPDTHLESFVAYYGANHVWPYARAELQAMSAKLGIPPLTLPVLKASQLPAGFTISQRSP